VVHTEFAASLRERLAREHLGVDTDVPVPAADHFRLFAESATRLESWRAGGRVGPRPSSRLRRLVSTQVSTTGRMLATAAYRAVYDPDGRPLTLRQRRSF
jgi:hypothetical protein